MVVEALREMNGFAKASAVKQWIADTLTSKGIEVPAINLASGASKFTNDIQWARMYLVNAGVLEPVEIAGRGNWKLTEKGKEIALDQKTAQKIYDSSAAKGTVAESENTAAPGEDDKQASLSASWETDLRDQLRSMTPRGFEVFCARLMGVSGIDARSTGQSGDGGIDGEGELAVGGFGLVKMRVAWQCKQYKGQGVTPKEVREFRGAINGRADYGIFFTTSSFSTQAISEAGKLGVIPVQLVDLQELIKLMGASGVGVKASSEAPNEIEADKEFFKEFLTPANAGNPGQTTFSYETKASG